MPLLATHSLTVTSPHTCVHTHSQVRCASAVTLVSLLTYCRGHPALTPRLGEVQGALGGLLGDSGELTQVSRVG